MAANCLRCHVQRHAKFPLDSRDAILQGGGTSKLVVPGAPEKSWLVYEIAYAANDTNSAWMPPQHIRIKLKALSPEEIGLIVGRVQQGAN